MGGDRVDILKGEVDDGIEENHKNYNISFRFNALNCDLRKFNARTRSHSSILNMEIREV